MKPENLKRLSVPPDKAAKILNGLKKKYPGHEIVPQIENYLASMK